MPRITVGIPAYKPAFLPQAMASVLSQSFADFELLISDDNPDDRVKAVVAGFNDPRIRLIEGPRRGLVPNSVHVWENAGADLLKFVYDDDFLLPGALERFHGELAADEALPFAFSWRHNVDAAGEVVSSPQPFKSDRPVRFAGQVLADTLVGGMINPIGEPTNLMIRRSRLAGASCLSAFCGVPIRHMIDVAFFLNAAAQGPCLGIPAFLAAFRRHPEQVTAQAKAPAFSAGLYEWELFIRGSVQTGLVAPATGLKALDRLDYAYDRFGAGFPELARFRSGIPELRTMLEADERCVLTETFLAQIRRADAAIEERLQSARRGPTG